MQGGNGYGYGYGYDAGGYVYDAGAYGSSGGAYYYSNGYPAPPGPEDPHMTTGRSAHGFPAAALDEVQLQPSDACPKNYVIFDQTHTGSSSVTFHPSLAHKLGAPSPASAHADDADDGCSPAREDSEEIDALLQISSEEDDDVTSTCSSATAGGGGGGGRPRKKDRIKKMVRALKGVVPGGKQMDTPAVLDEAVWYLKSLKLEAAAKKKHGVRGRSDT
ncbi:unnamed protein product [Urochloa humidicola]